MAGLNVCDTRRELSECVGAIGGGGIPDRVVMLHQTNPKTQRKAAAAARQGMDRGWGLLGFWRFVIGL